MKIRMIAQIKMQMSKLSTWRADRTRPQLAFKTQPKH